MSTQTILGIDIGGTKTAYILVDGTGAIIARHRHDTTDAADLVDRIVEYVGSLDPYPAAIGIGTTGIVDPDTGAIRTASDAIAGWSGFQLRAILETKLGIPVVVENDVNAFLLGEFSHGGHGTDNLLGVMLGTGVGGAALYNGTLIRGEAGAAAEIGHMPGFGDLPCTCGGVGHLETRSAGRAIAKRYTKRTGITATTQDVAQAARAGDEGACEVLYDAGFQLGKALCMAATLFDVTTVVIGGGVLGAWDILQPACHDALEAYPLVTGKNITIRHAQVGDDAVALGAIFAARAAIAS